MTYQFYDWLKNRLRSHYLTTSTFSSVLVCCFVYKLCSNLFVDVDLNFTLLLQSWTQSHQGCKNLVKNKVMSLTAVVCRKCLQNFSQQKCFVRHLSQKARDARTRALIDRIIRVDHAGELGADRIYAGQLAVLGNTPSGPVIQEMWEQEKEHKETFERLIKEHRVRPTAMLPLWNIAGFALGAGTALLGKEGAMACTVAVESVIGDHYNDQIRVLMEDDPEKHKELLEVIKKFRDDELHHHDTGLEHDAEKAPFYEALSGVIKLGCKGAIWISERI